MNLTLSDQGLEFIKGWEDLRLARYLDSAGLPTIGFGHLIVAGDNFPDGSIITEDLADSILANDLSRPVRTVNLCAIDLEQNEFDALVSFAFNEGCGALLYSTLWKKLNAGDKQGAAEQLLIWDKEHINGEVVQVDGLHVRRVAERNMFLNGIYDSSH